jgi:hypothetical protein
MRQLLIGHRVLQSTKFLLDFDFYKNWKIRIERLSSLFEMTQNIDEEL